MNTIVDSLHRDFSTLLAFLDEKKEVSLRSVADSNLRKTLLIAAASSFERCLTEIVIDYVKEATSEDHVLVWLVTHKPCADSTINGSIGTEKMLTGFLVCSARHSKSTPRQRSKTTRNYRLRFMHFWKLEG